MTRRRTLLGRIGEFGLIERIRQRTPRKPGVVVGIGDDAAVLSFNQKQRLLATCDLLVEGIHFTRRECTFEEIGHKALGCGLSDIAAMGGSPRYALVSVGLPRSMSVEDAEGLYRGLLNLANRFGVALVGGDTNRADNLVIDVTVLGVVETSRLVLRSGAKVGDAILVTGTLGGSRQGKHVRFTPRVREAQWLTRHAHLHAMMDISDGLAGDLAQLARESRVGAVLFEEAIPVSPQARNLQAALCDGEDFELLFTMGWISAQRLLRGSQTGLGVPIHIIGKVVHPREGLTLMDHRGRRRLLTRTGFRHF